MTDNVFSINSGTKQDVDADPNYFYTITLKDGSTHDYEGYLLLNGTFVGIAKGEGILMAAWPTSEFASVINHGPVPTASGLN